MEKQQRQCDWHGFFYCDQYSRKLQRQSNKPDRLQQIAGLHRCFEPTPTISLPADVTICDGVDYMLVANTTASFLEWFKDGVLVQSGPQNPSVLTQQVYTV